MKNAGEQLDGKTLYERQKTARDLTAPTVIAANLEKPENIGSLLRVADAAGCAGVILAQDRRLRHRERIFGAAVETQNHVRWRVSLVDEVVAGAAAIAPSLIAIELTTTSRNVFEVALPRECAFVIGNERYGIPDPVLKACDFAVHIPMFGVKGSMNVTHALAIALWEWRRQMSQFFRSRTAECRDFG